MRSHVRRSLSIAVAVTAGMALTVGAGAVPGGGETGGKGTGKGQSRGGVSHSVVLVTGDRVLVGPGGQVVGVQRAEGREGMTFRTRRDGRSVYVVPHDAERLIAAGKVDRKLFDITTLSTPESRRAYRDGVKVIVAYGGSAAAAAKAEVRTSGGAKARKALPAAGAEALTAAPGRATALWKALTDTAADGRVTATAGVRKIWLDGVVKASLDRTTKQIGAPAAWDRRYDGTGVRIAVLDTGIDGSHPDLAGKVVAERNFSSAADAGDRNGHGTHVASTAAGTGAKSGGTHKGVAPGAQLINGKVLDDFGSGTWSEIMAGIDWAVAQGADVVNMSLGGSDSPGVDPVEALVDKYTVEKGVLFAIAAGNAGSGAYTVGTPGTATGALTVGAVDDNDEIAFFSSRGPRFGDGGIKPDVTAPGVAVTAAAATGTVPGSPPGYTNMDGTSMAAPHAAGAAALLKQRHPDWAGARIKAALTSSAKPGPYDVFTQGSGRIAVDRAVTQPVVAEPASVSLGTHQWPHDDAAPATERLTYRNSGTADITFDIALAGAKGPGAAPVPAGLFSLGAQRITVPAGGTATLDVTADIRVPGTTDGIYQATVVATGDDGRTVVRTATAVNREPESYNVTVRALGRDGAPDPNAAVGLQGIDGEAGGAYIPVDLSAGERTVRLPKGRYTLSGTSFTANASDGVDLMVQPLLELTGNTTAVLDARTTKPINVTVPDSRAQQGAGAVQYLLTKGSSRVLGLTMVPDLKTLRTAHVGPAVTGGSLAYSVHSTWKRTGTDYNTVLYSKGVRFPTGATKHYRKADFARIDAGFGASVPGKSGIFFSFGRPADPIFWGFAADSVQPAQTRRNSFVSTTQGSRWEMEYQQSSNPDDWESMESAHASAASSSFKAGKTYRIDFNTAAHGPSVGEYWGVFRENDTLWSHLPLFSDGHGNHAVEAAYASARTTLHRGSTLIGRFDQLPNGLELATVPGKSTEYTLRATATRAPGVTRVGTRVDGSWTFRSARPAADVFQQLPLSTVRFTPAVALDSTAPAGRTQSFPVTVQGPAAGKNLKTLTVQISYDSGKKWRKVTVKNGKITVKNPAKGKGISIQAFLADKKGNKASVRILNAYLGK
ncbi:S8 family peptidase [Streptomyces qinzhouensis]|uniref:S8 family serine peptidase n=1 Tax=Streptomyces qinzhouensis TaxID=2599401 RepID=A0A5B8JBJ2_9ACTN|nr:S8 family serine peptidase [Streptomyces qinzhouensis]QDY78706.1 S8 family serine peptidase [Streptomyces qinzhouensis]